MNYSEAIRLNLFQSGDVIFYFNGSDVIDKTIEFVEHSLIYHTGIIVEREHGHLMLYQATDVHGINRVPLAAALAGQTVILIKTGLWSKAAEGFADSKIGGGYGFINAFLIDFYLNQKIFGFVCSTYVGDILNRAGACLELKGLTPSRLADALSKKKNEYIIRKD